MVRLLISDEIRDGLMLEMVLYLSKMVHTRKTEPAVERKAYYMQIHDEEAAICNPILPQMHVTKRKG